MAATLLTVQHARRDLGGHHYRHHVLLQGALIQY